MDTYLLTWNPEKWPWDDLDKEVKKIRRSGFLERRWSCGWTKKILPGDRIFLMRLGTNPPIGIIASGKTLKPPYEAPHWAKENRMAIYVYVKFDALLHPGKEEILSIEDLPKGFNWSPRGAGITIPRKVAANLEAIWEAHLEAAGLSVSPVARLAEEIPDARSYWEGASRTITVNAYERDAKAREACLVHHGCACAACGLDFSVKYGERGKGFIHVHHLIPLAQIRKKYQIDPINDLIPVCPNCHAMLHREPLLSVAELRKIILP